MDIFWFTVFHELGHIVNGDAPRYAEVRDDATVSASEDRADEFARNALLNPDDCTNFVNQRNFTLSAIEQFSKQQGVSRGVVVGRLQKDKRISWEYGTSLKSQIRLFTEPKN